MKAIETQDLAKTYGNGVEALIDLDLIVQRGEIFGFLGPNGAGKTTTLRLLNGTLTPTRGSSFVLALSSREEAIRRRTATLAESAQMYENLTVKQNLKFFARMYDLSARETETRVDELLKRMQLWEKRDIKFGSFSTGMKKRAQLARTLMHRPEIIFLDEPTSGLDPDAAWQVTNLIRKLAREEGTTIFLCTHNLDMASGICDNFGFISKGRLVKQGTKEELIRSVVEENKLEVTTITGKKVFEFNDEKEINGIIQKAISQGENITEVTVLRPSLRDVYFHYIERDEHEMV